MTPALDLQDLACIRGRRRLFQGVRLRVAAGQVLRVQGANGAGKTSLLRMLCGLVQPTEGQVLWRGEPVTTLREEFHAELIYIGHAAALKDDLSALENLHAACRLGGSRCTDGDALAALADAGLRGRERLPARVLSQGQRRRAALARLAIGQRQTLWVLDEPFNALDVTAGAWLAALVAAHATRGGIVVLTSHQPVALPSAVPVLELAL